MAHYKCCIHTYLLTYLILKIICESGPWYRARVALGAVVE